MRPQQHYRAQAAKLSKRPSIRGFVDTHRMRLEDAPAGYEMFAMKEDGCIKVVLEPS
jgi:threonine dehydrogenase-like Zn-dependent dehydrogenase